MNSDPHESAAWRAFGMLDADEAAGFDESMCQDPELRNAWREMNCLSAAVAAATVTPMAPRAGQLEKLQTRLGLSSSKHTNWLAITGWAAAAALTVMLVVDRQQPQAALSTSMPRTFPSPPLETMPGEKKFPQDSANEDSPSIAKESDSDNPPQRGGMAITQETEFKTITKVETKRLIQEIEVLRDKLESAQKRDQKRFEVVPGRAWPIVMRMSPPDSPPTNDPSITLADNSPPLTNVLGDALAGTSSMMALQPNLRTGETSQKAAQISAIPIYDASIDVGTLVTNLKQTNPKKPHFLWVKTENGNNPVLVGQLPASSSQGPDTFDFSLGKTAVVPAAFILTQGEDGKPTSPTSSNTILVGPR